MTARTALPRRGAVRRAALATALMGALVPALALGASSPAWADRELPLNPGGQATQIPVPPRQSPDVLAPPDTPRCDGWTATIVGADGGGVIYGTEGDDVIVGGSGNDSILGLGGDDIICGRDGNDVILGQAGDDSIHGELGDDILQSDGGWPPAPADTNLLHGGPGADILIGDDGTDYIYDTDSGFHDILFGAGGTDYLVSRDLDNLDEVGGGAGDDYCVIDAADRPVTTWGDTDYSCEHFN